MQLCNNGRIVVESRVAGRFVRRAGVLPARESHMELGQLGNLFAELVITPRVGSVASHPPLGTSRGLDSCPFPRVVGDMDRSIPDRNKSRSRTEIEWL